MSTSMRIGMFAGAMMFGTLACGYGSEATDNTPLEPSRNARITAIASIACDRYEACTGYGSDKAFQARSDCTRDYEDKAADMWPADVCSDGKINQGKCETCVDRVRDQACTMNFWDSVEALDTCDADEVCTD